MMRSMPLLAARGYNLTCFPARQAEEKAIKAFLYLSGWGTSARPVSSRRSSLNITFQYRLAGRDAWRLLYHHPEEGEESSGTCHRRYRPGRKNLHGL